MEPETRKQDSQSEFSQLNAVMWACVHVAVCVQPCHTVMCVCVHAAVCVQPCA